MELNNEKKIQHWYLHIDLDAFFASVEQLDNPEYRGKPVIVGGRKDDKRGVVSTASYEARKYGVHSAMPTFKAQILCPDGIFVRGRMKRYAELSYRIMNIFREYSPDVDQMSIDEAFVDLTGTDQLFGPPDKTALKIKKDVKDQTGLTVSVGLATTKYLAKIASGYSKPDGFYFVKPGQEREFMLNLPLAKVWGIGPKALEKLNRAGIKTTREVYNTPSDLLDFLLGPTMGKFLYKAIRGEENESFNRVAKSHSISAENTYHDDIKDIYTAETALLELAHGVMFRLLKEEKFSRTVAVKIKYDDFSSVSIQRTLDRNILTIDTFFEVIKELFEEKYEVGRGIRLLGVGFDKVEDTERPYQQSLFEDDTVDKKQAVEKAILDLNKKHPGIKIQKARLLKAIVIGLFGISSSIFAPKLSTQEISEITLPPPPPLPEIPEEAPSSFYQWEINDKTKVSFDVNGFWKGDITGNFTSSFDKDHPFAISPSIPVFKQDIELNSLFTLNNTWYFEANFADNFKNNTITVGFTGDNYLRSAKLSNRNITMPDVYSSKEFGFSLSGGNNQSPGISAHWQSPNDRWISDFLIRYDMTVPKTELFYGMNKVNKKIISPSSFLYGYSFTFPLNAKTELSTITDIYVETTSGNYIDDEGTKYKKLSQSDYYYSENDNILYFSQSAGTGKKDNKIPNILVTFSSDSSVDTITTKLGDYSNPSSYLGDIQSLFSYKLEKYAYSLSCSIDGRKALKIQTNEGFSPFLIADTYELGASVKGDVSVILKTSEKKLDSFFAEIIDNSQVGPYEDFINKKKSYGKVVNKEDKKNQYPFAKVAPEIYLNLESFSDIAISLTNYIPVNQITISKKASSGTIQVYRNGVYDNNFIYDSNTGTITLLSNVSNTDIIKVMYQEEASDYAKGVFSLGLGYSLNILPNLIWDISLTGQYPLILKDSYATQNNLQTSFVALSTGLDYSLDNFTINDKLAASIQKANTSDILLVSTQTDKRSIFYNYNSNDSSLIKEEIQINTLPIPLTKDNNVTKEDIKGITDPELKAYKLPLSWAFTEKKQWSGINVKLHKGDLLKNSSSLNLRLQLGENTDLSDLRVFIQLGIDSSKNKQSTIGIKTIDITNDINSIKTNEWNNINISLTDKDRSFLLSSNDMRVIVYNENSSKNEGTIYIGSYQPVIESIFTHSEEHININTTSSPSGKDSFSSVVSWNNSDSNGGKDNTITAVSYFTPTSFNQYKKVNIKFAFEKEGSINENTPIPLKIILDSNSITPLDKGNEAIRIEFEDISSYINELCTYHTITVDLLNSSVLIDNNSMKAKLFINKNVVPSRVKYELDTSNIKKGSFYVDNITYSESDIEYSIQNNIKANYKKDDILKINDYELIKNGFIDISSKQKFIKNNFSVLSNLNTGITLANISMNLDFAMSNLEFTTVGHNLKTDGAILGLISVTEDYRWNKTENTHKKENTASLSLSKFNVPLNINTNFSADNNKDTINQNHVTSVSSSFNIKETNISLSSSMQTSQNINLQKNSSSLFNKDDYFESWKDLSTFEFSLGDTDAASRNEIFSNQLKVNINNNFVVPSIFYNLSGNYENIKETSYEDKITLRLSLPFSFDKYYVSFNLEKIGGDITPLSIGGTYLDDLSRLFSTQSDRVWFYSSIPFYELFDTSIENKIKGNYSAKYEVNFKKTLFNSMKDLFIPSQFSLAIARDIKSKETFSDVYQIKANVATNSINNFGSMSKNKIFSFFTQEEITSGLTTIIKIPKDELSNTEFNVTAYLQVILFLENYSLLNNNFDFSIDNSLNWSTRGTLTYLRNGKTSLITSLISLFSKDFDINKYKITRKDMFKYDLGQVDSKFKQQYDYMHSVDVGFLEHFTVTTGIGGTFSHIEDGALNVNLNYNIGGKISF